MNKIGVKLGITYIILAGIFTILMIVVNAIPSHEIEKNVCNSAHFFPEKEMYIQVLPTKYWQLDNYTDVTMLNICASAKSDTPVYSAMTNPYHEGIPTKSLLTYSTFKSKIDVDYYGRYWHGYQVTLRPLLFFLNYRGILTINYFVLLSIVTFLIYALWKHLGIVEAISVFVGLLAVALPIIPMSLQFSTCFYISLLSTLIVIYFPAIRKSIDHKMIFFFIVGAFTSFMDFLTAPIITFGLPYLVMTLLTKENTNKLKEMLLLFCSWCLGYGLLWATKWGICYILTGENILTDAISQAELRLSDIYVEPRISIFTHLWNNLLKISYGWLVIIPLLWLYWKFNKGYHVMHKYGWLVVLAILPPLWLFMLWNHTQIHFFFSYRNLFISIVCILLFVQKTFYCKA